MNLNVSHGPIVGRDRIEELAANIGLRVERIDFSGSDFDVAMRLLREAKVQAKLPDLIDARIAELDPHGNREGSR